MRRALFYIPLVILGGAVGWSMTGFILGGNVGWQSGGALTAIFVLAAVAIAIRRLPGGWRVAAGLLLIGLLVFPAVIFMMGFPGGATSAIGPPLLFPVVGVLAVGIIVTALLFHAGVTFRSVAPGGRSDAGRIALLPIAVGGLLLAMILQTFYWLMVWDSTYDPIGAIVILFLVMIAVLTGAILMMTLRGWARSAGAFFLLTILLSLILVAFIAQRSDFRRITESRAEKVSRALETYHAREGDYPATLTQLTPRDALYLAGPVIMFGQSWCYDTDGGTYRLGYVDREHWSDPRLIGRIHSSTGNSADSQPMCANEIDRLIDQYPDFFGRRVD